MKGSRSFRGKHENGLPIVPLDSKGEDMRMQVDSDDLPAESCTSCLGPPSPRRNPGASRSVSSYIKFIPLFDTSPLRPATVRLPSLSFRPPNGGMFFGVPNPGGKDILEPVFQMSLFPPSLRAEDVPRYLPEDNVILGENPVSGCYINYPDSVSRETLPIRTPTIVICFMWLGYEEYGVFKKVVNIPRFQDDPYNSRLKILADLRGLYQEFRNKVASRRSVTGQDSVPPELDVLSFGDNFRVISLDRRYESIYQVVFAYRRDQKLKPF